MKNINNSKIQLSRNIDKRTITLSLNRKKIKLRPFVKIGDAVCKNQIIAANVKINNIIPCQHKVDLDYYI